MLLTTTVTATVTLVFERNWNAHDESSESNGRSLREAMGWVRGVLEWSGTPPIARGAPDRLVGRGLERGFLCLLGLGSGDIIGP